MQYTWLLVTLGASFGSVAHAQDRLFVLDTSPVSMPDLVELDPVSATPINLLPVTGHEALFGGLAIDGAGDLYSIDGYNDALSDRTFRIDAATGAGTVVGDTNSNWNFRSVAVNPVDDGLYGWRDNELFRIDKVTGAAISIASVGPAMNLDQGTAFAISTAGVGYVTDIGGNSLFSVDIATGAATFLGDLNTGSSWFNDLDFDGAGVLWGVHNGGGIYRITLSPATATMTFSTPTYTGIAFERGDIGTTYCIPAVANSTGAAAQVRGTGSVVVASNSLTLEADHLPVFSFSFFITSRTTGFAANPGGSQGNLCLGGAIGRFVGPGQVQNSGLAGEVELDLDLTALPTPNGLVAAAPGETWSFQAWYRDSSPSGPTSNFTNGFTVTLQ
ncbi:hypothetical protein Poly30_23240 [Planctomycetes bacterium Poly30]|uniref:DUF6923 domain-containing protein n=1 Tax=Saltatorellus ferox TaxID=2528018 RepID=A0A518ERT8_9BACT|nr:hypothetical protein Poly30_23240 [Planctomycetes bacterium Poly30]